MIKKKGFPTEGELVIITVKNITPYSALCAVDEYPGKEGMIHVSEVAGKWVRDIKTFVKQGKQYVAKVTGVDQERGHINLSLRRVSKREGDKKLQDSKKEEHAEKMLELMGKKLGLTLAQTYEKIGYQLQETFGDMFVAFNAALENPELLKRRGIDEKYIKLMEEISKENIQKKEFKIKAILELKFYSGDGINRVKEFLNSLQDKYKWEIKYISAPKYSVEIKASNPKQAERDLKEKLAQEVSKIKDGEVTFNIRGK